MTHFSDRPFVAGSLIGLRAFDVDSLGRLVGPSHGTVFTDVENEAECIGGDFARVMRRATARLAASLQTQSRLRAVTYNPSPYVSYTMAGARTEPTQSQPEPEDEQEPEHVIGGVGCTCGYYAYFDGANDYASTARVSAIVEGYGVCTVGERGFRASKARLTAIVIPSKNGASRWDRFSLFMDEKEPLTIMGTVVLAIGLGLGVTTLSATFSAWFSLLFAPIALGVVAAVKASFHGIDVRIDRRYTGSTFDAALVRRNYPEVPVYPTVEAALRAHPLTAPEPPPVPSPADDDFWTRSAS